MANYSVYNGSFLCHTCKEEVKSLRLYSATQSATWMCKDKHLSTVKFGKQKRSDYDRKK